MKRREFLTAAGAAAATTLVESEALAAGVQGGKPEYYELRKYHQRMGPKPRMMDEYYRDVAIPGMQRAGIGPIGVFNVMVGPDQPTLHVLIKYDSLEQFAEMEAKLAQDKDYQAGGADYRNLPFNDPAYTRYESSLMVAFSGMPKMEVPEKKGRIFELRTYESHNKKAFKKKVDMFNNGEIDIFRKSGVKPVFFGATLIGDNLPNLAYMVTFENLEARAKAFTTFATSPEWRELSGKPEYANLVTNISNTILTPTGYSQI